MEKQIRVLVANSPRLMREMILATFAEQPDIEVVGEVTDENEIASTVQRTQPDFLVISQERMGRRPSVCDVVLHRHPEVRIIALAPEQNYSVHYWISQQIHCRDVEASEAGILQVLRGRPRALGSPA